MEYRSLKKLGEQDRKEIFDLWNNEYPANLNYKELQEFEQYLENLTEQSHILMKDEHDQVQGWYFDFIREEERWFAIILNSALHGKGFGTKLLNLAKEKEGGLNGWVIDHEKDRKKDGSVYRSPLKFYLKNEFKTVPEIRLELDFISAVKIVWRKSM